MRFTLSISGVEPNGNNNNLAISKISYSTMKNNDILTFKVSFQLSDT